MNPGESWLVGETQLYPKGAGSLTGSNHDFSEAFDVGLLKVQNCFDLELLGFSKIWRLLLKNFLAALVAKTVFAVVLSF